MSEEAGIPQDDSASARQIEREQLTREVKEELRRQKLRDEIVATLSGNSWTTRLARFSTHPAFTVFVSFALTGLIGTALTERWQRNEWKFEQSQHIRLHRIDDEYGIRDAIIKAVATHNAAIRNTAWALDLEPKMSEESRKKLAQDLREDQREWNSESQVLRLKLHLYFGNDSDITKDFEDFIRKRASALYPEMEFSLLNGDQTGANESGKKQAYELLGEERISLERLTSRMTEEIEESSEEATK